MSLCVLLDWDSQFFRRRIGRVTVERLSGPDLIAIERWARAQRIDCLYFLASFHDAETLRLAPVHGFELMDLRLTLERAVSASATPASVRRAVPADLPALQTIARGAFPNTRFSRDPRLEPYADSLYATWVERALGGFADAVLVAVDADGAPAGFVCCHRRGNERGELGLTAVRSDLRGQGVGGMLVTAAQAWFHAQDLAFAFVVTNGANLVAQRLYQRHGYVSTQVQLWYHRWFGEHVLHP
jgi:dTDP-4-amino-4,6-dideoxy-D-galactose acyltransferase